MCVDAPYEWGLRGRSLGALIRKSIRLGASAYEGPYTRAAQRTWHASARHAPALAAPALALQSHLFSMCPRCAQLAACSLSSEANPLSKLS